MYMFSITNGNAEVNIKTESMLRRYGIMEATFSTG